MRGVSQVLLQRCISRGSETYKTGGMGLTKTFKEFLFLHQSAYVKKTLQEQLHLSEWFYRQKLSVFVFSWIQGSDKR